MWTNYHTHTNFCDGKASLKDTLMKAISSRMRAIGFSSHAPLPFDKPWCMKYEKLDEYLSEIRELKNESKAIQVYAGLEIDFVPGQISPIVYARMLDYTIGSVHFVDQFEDGSRWEIDNTLAVFTDGLDRIFKNDVKAAITRYQELTREMVENFTPDVVGHLDKIKIHNTDNRFFSESDKWYRDEIEKTLQSISRAGCIVEINTRGIYQKKSSDTYPSRWVIERMKELKIPVTLSSDAHHPDDLINQFQETARTLGTIGIEKIHVLINNCWKGKSFDEHGISEN